MEACWAHNSEVGGSKPFAAIFLKFFKSNIKIKIKTWAKIDYFQLYIFSNSPKKFLLFILIFDWTIFTVKIKCKNT